MAEQGTALAMTTVYVLLASELAKASGRQGEAFAKYEELLRAYIDTKQHGAERFAEAPQTQWRLFFRNQVIKAFGFRGSRDSHLAGFFAPPGL
jgi:2-polyprenyl-6-methoxyphenol hydroxylase-like FAD-dependent oxidoreductase